MICYYSYKFIYKINNNEKIVIGAKNNQKHSGGIVFLVSNIFRTCNNIFHFHSQNEYLYCIIPNIDSGFSI